MLALDVSEAGWRLITTTRHSTQTIYAAPGEPDIAALSGLLSGLSRKDRARPFGVRVPHAICLERQVSVPHEALADVEPIVLLDMERKTPFRREAVFTATYLEPGTDSSGALIDVTQMILKRNVVDPLIDALRKSGIDVAFLDTWNADGTAPLPVNLLAPTHPAARAPKAAYWVLGLAVAAVAYATSSTLSTRATALQDADAQAAAALAEMRSLRQSIESGEAELARFSALFTRKASEISQIELVNELTRLLPDEAWVQSLRIEGATVDVNGLAKSATALLPLFDSHPVFSEATLIAPVTAEPGQDRERFSLRLRLRRPAEKASAASGAAP